MHNCVSAVPGVLRGLLLGTAISMSPLVSHAALVDFSGFENEQRVAINGVQTTLTKDGITAKALRYFGGTWFSSYPEWISLWIRNDEGDHGLGVCSEGLQACGGTDRDRLVEGRGDWNELGNNRYDEVIRLERSDNEAWSDFWVSSLDTKIGPGREHGRFYWSNEAKADLNDLPSITFGQDLLDWEETKVEGSIYDYLVRAGFDRTAKFVYFRADDIANGSDNDYLVYKAGTTAVPVPPSLLLLGSALAALGFVPRRKP